MMVKTLHVFTKQICASSDLVRTERFHKFSRRLGSGWGLGSGSAKVPVKPARKDCETQNRPSAPGKGWRECCWAARQQRPRTTDGSAAPRRPWCRRPNGWCRPRLLNISGGWSGDLQLAVAAAERTGQARTSGRTTPVCHACPTPKGKAAHRLTQRHLSLLITPHCLKNGHTCSFLAWSKVRL